MHLSGHCRFTLYFVCVRFAFNCPLKPEDKRQEIRLDDGRVDDIISHVCTHQIPYFCSDRFARISSLCWRWFIRAQTSSSFEFNRIFLQCISSVSFVLRWQHNAPQLIRLCRRTSTERDQKRPFPFIIIIVGNHGCPSSATFHNFVTPCETDGLLCICAADVNQSGCCSWCVQSARVQSILC